MRICFLDIINPNQHVGVIHESPADDRWSPLRKVFATPVGDDVLDVPF